MDLSHLALRPPLWLVGLLLVPAALGIIALPNLPVERFPAVPSRVVEVRVSHPGAAPEDVDRQVTELIEDAVSGIKGLELIASTSRQGASNISLSFSEAADLATAVAAVERRIGSIRRRLPSGAGEPTISTASEGGVPLMQVVLTSDWLAVRELFDLAADRIAPRLRSVPGVADVSVSGGSRSEIQVRVDLGRMASQGVSLAQVQNAVRNWTAPSPAARMRTDTQIFTTRTVDFADQLSDLEKIVVASTPGGRVDLKDIAMVVQASDVQTSLQRFDQKDAVVLRIAQQSGVNAIRVDAALREALQALVDSYGPSAGLTATVTSEQARFAQAAIDGTSRSLFLAVLFAALVLMLFLHNPATIPVLVVAVPAALLPTFVVMDLLEMSIDTLSLMALTLVVGLLVDDSIVVIEGIHRHMRLGQPAWDAALHGLSELGAAMIATTLVSLGLLIPLLFAGGSAGPLFRDFGLVAAVATAFSVLMSLLLVPALTARMPVGGSGVLSGARAVWELGFGALQDGYRALLALTLRHRWLPLLVGFAMLYVVLAPGFVRSEFVPREDENRFTLSVSPPIDTTIGVTDAATRTVEERLREVREVAALLTSVRDDSASIEVHLVDKSHRAWSAVYLANEVGDLGLDIPTMETRASAPSPLGGGGGGGNDLTIMVRGPDMLVLERLANEVLRVLAPIAGLEDEATSAFDTVPEYRAVVNPERAADLGVTRQAVASALSAAIAPADVSTFRLASGIEVDVVVQVERAGPSTPEALGAVPIQTSRGTTVRLDQVATILPGTRLREINRYDRQRQVSIEADITGRPRDEVIAEIAPKLQQLRLPAGYDLEIVEPRSPLNDAVAALFGPMAFAGVLVFIVLAQLYGSLIYPWVVLLCVPMGLVGAFLGLRMTGNTLNLFSIMAMLIVMALAAKHAILLLDHASALRRGGIPRGEALLEAGQTRLQPIVMTGLTFAFALWPLTSRASMGAESRAPGAVVFIGGLVASMLVTLVVVPCAYSYLDDLQRAFLSLGRRGRPLPVAVPPPEARGVRREA